MSLSDDIQYDPGDLEQALEEFGDRVREMQDKIEGDAERVARLLIGVAMRKLGVASVELTQRDMAEAKLSWTESDYGGRSDDWRLRIRYVGPQLDIAPGHPA